MSISKKAQVTAKRKNLTQNTKSRPEQFEPNATLKTAHQITFPEWLVFLNGCIPLIMLAFDARYHRLGPDPIDNALNTTGMLGVLSLVATLSITPLRKTTGYNALFYLRRPLGLLSFLYALLHVGIFVVHDRAGDINDAWNEICQRRYLQIGAIAFVILVPLTITSTPRMLNWLGFNRWKLLHRSVYLAAVLAVVHQYLQTRADITRPVALGALLSGLLSYRVLSAIQNRLTSKHLPQDEFTIKCNGKTLTAISGDTTILDAADAAGISLPSDCRSGVCGTCKVRLIHGTVEMDTTDALSSSDLDKSIILACQATCRSDVKIKTLVEIETPAE